METASPIAKQFNIPIETDERIIEQDLGIFSGMSYKELEHPDDYIRSVKQMGLGLKMVGHMKWFPLAWRPFQGLEKWISIYFVSHVRLQRDY